MTPGGRLGCYAIVSTPGAGGMGEVWRSRQAEVKIGPKLECGVAKAFFDAPINYRGTGMPVTR